MRAVKSVLVMAGKLKRADPDMVEDVTLIRALRDSNIPKFLAPDIPLFEAILRDLFPGVVVPAIDYGDVKKYIESAKVTTNTMSTARITSGETAASPAGHWRHMLVRCGMYHPALHSAHRKPSWPSSQKPPLTADDFGITGVQLQMRLHGSVLGDDALSSDEEPEVLRPVALDLPAAALQLESSWHEEAEDADADRGVGELPLRRGGRRLPHRHHRIAGRALPGRAARPDQGMRRRALLLQLPASTDLLLGDFNMLSPADFPPPTHPTPLLPDRRVDG